MRPFSTSVLEVASDTPRAFKPLAFDGHVSEARLEAWVVANPELVGERLLVLGQQLAEFEEDQDRLDVLAIDEDGEIVLIELKVAENFRLTDLQAVAYAGAYASREPSELAQTLRRTMQKQADTATDSSAELCPSGALHQDGSVGLGMDPPASPHVTVDQSKERIVSFLELDDFDDWQPSQQVRIKLVAPRFPRRVLKTVKWLGEVYNMPIEAIAVRLFLRGDDRYTLTFERLLPLPEEGEFDLTVRRREERKRSENATRRPALVPILAREGLLQDGQTLWVSRTVLRPQDRALYDPDAVAFQVVVHIDDVHSSPKFAWRAAEDQDAELLSPSAVAHRVYQSVTDWEGERFYFPVAKSFTVKPDGPTLEQLATDHGVWT